MRGTKNKVDTAGCPGPRVPESDAYVELSAGGRMVMSTHGMARCRCNAMQSKEVEGTAANAHGLGQEEKKRSSMNAGWAVGW